MFKVVLIQFILLSLLALEAKPLELRYQVCTVEELRRYLEQFCMRLGRDTNSFLSMSPYGSMSALEGSPGQDSVLIDILRASRPLHGHSGSRQWLSKRQHHVKRDQEAASPTLCDYLVSCCKESCVIDPEDLLPRCSSMWSSNRWS